MKAYNLNKDTLLSVRNLKTYFKLKEGNLKAVNNISFDIKKGEVLGIVGESGSGKSITSRTILRLIKKPGQSEGQIIFNGEGEEPIDLIPLKPNGLDLRKLRGNKISMIFQEPMNALSPVHTIGNQLTEAMMIHDADLTKEEAYKRGVQLLKKVGIANPEARINEYPFQMSGGMRQRVMIAMAISCNPELLIADEPTTALDVSVQAQILKLLKSLQKDYNMSMIFITHDLSVVAQMADKIAVMYLGKIVEKGSVEKIFYQPAHPYTRKLLSSLLDPGMRYNRKELETIKGNVPEPINLPNRCPFFDRCEEKDEELCNREIPEFTEVDKEHYVLCHCANAVKEEEIND